LALLKLCIQFQGEHNHGNKGNFWKKMSTLLHQEHGVLLKDPQSTVDDMVAPRCLLLAQDPKKSGVAQSDTDLLQPLDLWIEFEDEKQRLKDEAKKSAATKEKEAQEAADRRSNLFKPRGQKKKKRAQEVDDEGEGGPTDSEYEVDGDERSQKRKKGASEDTLVLVDALEDFGDGIQEAIVMSAEMQSGNGAIAELKAQIEAEQKQAEKSRSEIYTAPGAKHYRKRKDSSSGRGRGSWW
jgi:hypothetical protein